MRLPILMMAMMTMMKMVTMTMMIDENTDKSDSAEYCCSYSDGHPLAMLQQFQALEAASDVYMPLCQPPKPQNLQMPRDKTMRLRVQEGDNFGRTIIMSEE